MSGHVSGAGDRPARGSAGATGPPAAGGPREPTGTAPHPSAAAHARLSAAATATPIPVAPYYEGLITRAIAFTVDAAIINAVAVAVGAAVGLSLSALSIPDSAKGGLLGLGGFVYLLWSVSYFVGFWSATGQTPGNRMLGIRVARAADDDSTLRPSRALLRLIALTLCAIPLLIGFLPILFNDRRRGLHDMVAGSVVVAGPVHAMTRDRPPGG
ncbi:RDD family protein [Conexibacter sp. CPCC 206217]|uniref:RDD family protein n=1 Tax=Conexibacter sp. CPCC 206217 TaxID=3064574 RepID=UPI00271D6ABB|nr:RDD family protein [Conexibacter sp. CPCC 206217]MDO8214202.1 RDD family protein [Conexibacter sp. CPCC 206217]